MSDVNNISIDERNATVLAHQEEGEANLWLGGRGPRLTPSQKRRIKEFCLNRDGIRCMICDRDADAGPSTGDRPQLKHSISQKSMNGK